MQVWTLGLWWRLAEPARAADGDVVLLDGIAAVVGERLVFRTDVEMEREFLAFEPCPLQVLVDRRRADPLQAAVDFAMIRGLAGTVGVYQPRSEQVSERLEAMFQAATSPVWEAFLRRHDLEGVEIYALAYNRLVVERYVQRNFLGGSAPGLPADQGLEAYVKWIDALRARGTLRLVQQ
jgi:hypothetical protein